MPEKAARAKAVKALARQKAATTPLTVRPTATRSAEAARAFAIEAARLMADDKCEDVVVLDLRGLSPVCDFFVIGTGTSDRQMRAAAAHVEQLGKSQNDPPYGVGGMEEGVWIIVDFVDVVVHFFDDERRRFYDLESLWGDGARVEWMKK
ncbi:MAG: ribosome silencing factor [Planctomycetota bacterium]|nr:MAG: ribosome silencing factor [Planctomycetota bacterium]